MLADQPPRVGMKGASDYGKTADASTRANAVSEERSEALDRSRSGLSGARNSAWLQSILLRATERILKPKATEATLVQALVYFTIGVAIALALLTLSDDRFDRSSC